MSDFLTPLNPEQFTRPEQQAPDVMQIGQLGDAIRIVTSDCAPPKVNIAVPLEGLKDVFRLICGFLRDFDVPRWIASIVAGIAVSPLFIANAVLSLGISVLSPFIGAFAQEALGLLDQLRKNIDPAMASVAVEVLNELLGTEFNVTHIPQGFSAANHIERATVVGGLLHDQLLREFGGPGDVTPEKGRDAARTFSGFLINFGTATGIIATLGGLVPFVHLDEVREIAEEVARNLGLGRLHRMVMKPLLTLTVATPYGWYLNKLFHPTQFKVGEIINPFTSTLMDQAHVYEALDLAGYSDDKKAELIKLHQKRLSLDDVEILKRWGYWDETVTHKYLVELGWPEELAETAGRIPELKRIDGRINKLVDKLESAVDQGHLVAEDALAIIKTLPVTEDEQAVIRATMMTFTKVPHRSLTLTEIQQAFIDGLVTVDDVVTRLQRLGFNGDDLSVLTELILLKFAHAEEAKAAAAARHQAAVGKAKAKGNPAPKQPPILANPATP